MALQHGIDENDNGVFVSGPQALIEYDAASAITPGAVVVTNATDGQIDEAGAGAANALGYAMDNTTEGATDLRGDYASGDSVPVNVATGSLFMGILANNESISTGDSLKTAASGELAAFTATTSAADNDGSDEEVAVYVGKADQAPTGGSIRILAKWVK